MLETPEQEILRLNNVLAKCISAITLLKKENNNLKQEIALLKSETVQLDPETIKEEPTSGNGLKQFVYIRYA